MNRTWLSAGLGVGLIVAGVAPAVLGQQRAIRTVSSISAQDKASGAKQHPELLKEFGGAYVGPQARYVESVGRRIAVQSGLSNAQAISPSPCSTPRLTTPSPSPAAMSMSRVS